MNIVIVCGVIFFCWLLLRFKSKEIIDLSIKRDELLDRMNDLERQLEEYRNRESYLYKREKEIKIYLKAIEGLESNHIPLVLKDILDSLCKSLNLGSITLYVYDAAGETFQLLGTVPERNRRDKITLTEARQGRMAVAYCIDQRKLYFPGESRMKGKYHSASVPDNDIYAIPVFFRGEILGVMELVGDQGLLSRSDLALIQNTVPSLGLLIDFRDRIKREKLSLQRGPSR